MKNKESELNEVASPTVETENEVSEKVVRPYGKFKDAETLLKAYESLESEFTRRSQRLKAIEGELLSRSKEDKAREKVEGKATAEELVGRYPLAEKFAEEIKGKQLSDGDGFQGVEDAYIKILERELSGAENKLKVNENESLQQDFSQTVIKDYLKKVMNAKSKVKQTGGNMILLPPKRPSTIAEASLLAKNYIKRKGE